MVKYLLKWKNTPDAVNTPNNAGRTCLHIAAIINNLPLCKLLLDNGAEKNSVMMHKVQYDQCLKSVWNKKNIHDFKVVRFDCL